MSEGLFSAILDEVYNQDLTNKWRGSQNAKLRELSLTGRGAVGELYFQRLCESDPEIVGLTSYNDDAMVPPHGDYDGIVTTAEHMRRQEERAISEQRYLELTLDDYVTFEIKTISEDSAGYFQVNNISPDHFWEYLLVFKVMPGTVVYSIYAHDQVRDFTLVPMKGGSAGCYKLTLNQRDSNAQSQLPEHLKSICQQKGFPC